MQSVHEKLDRMLRLEVKVEEHSKSITRLKTWWSVVAAGIALVVSSVRGWLVR
jgi:hypothetical protein